MGTNENCSNQNTCHGTCSSCDNDGSGFRKRCEDCYISTEVMTHTRRCFMTGEYCSQQTNIRKERKALYEQDAITAFVIMNFSDMSDVLYKWRIEPFVESLKKYLYITDTLDPRERKLYCSDEKSDTELKEKKLKRIKKIKVIRADSDPASNYVICSRICQQMQIADLIIVDVSWKNANVFYEFGMAVALQKLILPVCYSESFYKMEVPAKIKSDLSLQDYEHHIGCYPWRKELFEYYGIRFKQNKKNPEARTRYMNLDEGDKGLMEDQYSNGKKWRIIDEFSDARYLKFPYDDDLDTPDGQTKKIGSLLYENLQEQYNNAGPQDNTLVIYTMDSFLNEDEAWLCIVNFYHSITKRMKTEHCFEGDRVGVLVQPNTIPENDKDTETRRSVTYDIGEIIRIGVNQATYTTTKDKLEAEDVLQISQAPGPDSLTEDPDSYKKRIHSFIKEHISNKSILIYPKYPVHVQRLKEQQPDMIPISGDSGECRPQNAFTLYHVMLKTLRYTNEIVVDITRNCPESLFWLGAAHGSEIDAITVRHEMTAREKEAAEFPDAYTNRKVFDVAGLWTAVHQTHNTENFYDQLTLAQYGIERHSKLMPPESKWRGLKKWGYLSDEEEEKQDKDTADQNTSAQKLFQLKAKKEALESYYRRRFWTVMLHYNRLSIYMPQHDDKIKGVQDQKPTFQDNNAATPTPSDVNAYDEPRVRVARWDMDAVSALTHYLSKRSIIGEYLVVTVGNNQKNVNIDNSNFICVGNTMKLQKEAFTEHIGKALEKSVLADNLNRIHVPNLTDIDSEHPHYKPVSYNKCPKKKVQVKGFYYEKDNIREEEIFTQHPWPDCFLCSKTSAASPKDHADPQNSDDLIYDLDELDNGNDCRLLGRSCHTEIAQLILWRENGKDQNSHFRVALVGSSGPATYGLSSLFVDKDQKLYNFLDESQNKNREGIDSTLLYDLQKAVRKKVMSLLMEQLEASITEGCSKVMPKDKTNAIPDSNKYIALSENDIEPLKKHLLYTLGNYLSTVLYRYFLPFLSAKDMNRIHNNLYLFVKRFNAATVHSQFGVGILGKEGENTKYKLTDREVLEITAQVPQTVRTLLEKFKGLEAFYKVTVTHGEDSSSSSDTDNRKVRKVEALHEDYRTMNLFIPDPQTSQTP